VSANNQI